MYIQHSALLMEAIECFHEFDTLCGLFKRLFYLNFVQKKNNISVFIWGNFIRKNKDEKHAKVYFLLRYKNILKCRPVDTR